MNTAIAARIDTPAYRAGALMAWIETADRELWYRYWPLVMGGSGHALTNMLVSYERMPAVRRKGEREGIADALEQLVPDLPGLHRTLSTQERSEIHLGYYHQLAAWR